MQKDLTTITCFELIFDEELKTYIVEQFILYA